MLHPLTQFRADHALSMEALAVAIGASKSMVSKWERWLARPSERYMQLICDYTSGAITPNDFYRISSPACSSAGESAGASSPQRDAPAACQGRAEAARLAHNQEVAGSSPAPATSFQSPDFLPSGVKAGARCLDDASRAPASFDGERIR